MEERNELSDIVLEKEDESKNLKLKRILIIVAVLVLLFLAVLIIMRALNKPDKSHEARLVLPPEPQSAPTTQTDKERLFQQVPIIEEEEKESFEDMVRKLKEKEMLRSSDRQAQVQNLPAQVKEPAPTPVKEPETVLKPQVKIQAKPEPKPQAQERTPTPKPTPPAQPAQSSQNIATPGIYIQVASVSRKNPDVAYLATLTKKGYDYKLYRTTVNNKDTTKILVGPYENNTAAQNALANVKRDLASGAFIFRVP